MGIYLPLADVAVLDAGGIHRYMEAFPDGGFFAGKNFVFDERVTVAGGSGKVVGSCSLCAAPHDSYEPRCRCSHCRMLVLVCPDCASLVQLLTPTFSLQAHRAEVPLILLSMNRGQSVTLFNIAGAAARRCVV